MKNTKIKKTILRFDLVNDDYTLKSGKTSNLVTENLVIPRCLNYYLYFNYYDIRLQKKNYKLVWVVVMFIRKMRKEMRNSVHTNFC